MKCSEIIRQLDRLAPESYACEWDNPGLLTGRTDKEVKKVLVALDATDEVIVQALREQVHMVVTHHPLIFQGLKKITNQDFLGRRLISIIQADISYYAMHTNYDAAPGCMADLTAARLELTETEPLDMTGEQDGVPYGIGKIGSLPAEMNLAELAALVKERFQLPYVTIYGAGQTSGSVRRVAISPGSGKSMIAGALKAGVQVLITGDIGHHDGIDAAASQMAIIDAGHYGLEYIFIEALASYLEQEFTGELEVLRAEPAFPATII